MQLPTHITVSLYRAGADDRCQQVIINNTSVSFATIRQIYPLRASQFEWGSANSGSLLTAFAIYRELFGPYVAFRCHKPFCYGCIAHLDATSDWVDSEIYPANEQSLYPYVSEHFSLFDVTMILTCRSEDERKSLLVDIDNVPVGAEQQMSIPQDPRGKNQIEYSFLYHISRCRVPEIEEEMGRYWQLESMQLEKKTPVSVEYDTN